MTHDLWGHRPSSESNRGLVLAVAVRWGALAVAAYLLIVTLGTSPAVAAPSSTPFAIVPGSFTVTPSTNQAGAHPDLSISFEFAHNEAGETFNDARTTSLELPPGLIGNPTAVPNCTEAQLLGPELKPECPPASQVGTISFKGDLAGAGSVTSIEPIYNMAPAQAGVAAELAFRGVVFTQNMPLTLLPGAAGLTLNAPALDLLGEPHDVSVSIWGVPAEAAHDPQRGQECVDVGGEPECPVGDETAGEPLRPFLSNPTACGPAVAILRADSWEEPEAWSQASAEAGPIVECEKVPFSPAVEAGPTAGEAESPSGFALTLRVPQSWDDPASVSSAALEGATVTLPSDLSLNPSFATGLGACAPPQLQREAPASLPAAGCPESSKIGAVEVENPILPEPARGSIFLATPFDNPVHSRFAAYVIAKAPARGLLVELAFALRPDLTTGRVAISFEEGPQLPFSRLTLRFPEGQHALLVTPSACGSYDTQAVLTPWSTPTTPSHLAVPFTIASGARGRPCPSGAPPFHPTLSVGPAHRVAGAFAALEFRLSREDGEAQINGFSLRLPPGLAGQLAGVPFCSDVALEAARRKSAAEELSDPSCPAASRIGDTLIAGGAGTLPASVQGKAYLAGPYGSAPLSVAVVTPLLLGPFDLGTIVARDTFRADPKSGAVQLGSSTTEPLPQVVDGIPLRLRELRVRLDRPDFIRNSTSCHRSWVTGTVTGQAGGELEQARVASPLHQVNCRRLPFHPSFRLALLGGVHRNGHPAVRVVLAARPGEARLAHTAIFLPGSELLDPGHIGSTCEPPQLASRRCPPASIYGHAKAVSPDVSEPLRGPVYLYADSESRLPDLVAALHSRRVDFDLTERLHLRAGSLEAELASPDVPISRFVLETAGGSKGLLVNSVDLCTHPQRLRARLVAHNGKTHVLHTQLAAGCSRGPRRHRRTRPAPDRSAG